MSYHKRWLILVLLGGLAVAQQVNSDLIPTTTGLNLGHSNQRWNGFFNNLNITGTCVVNGNPCLGGGGTGNVVSGGNNSFTGTNIFAGSTTFTGPFSVSGGIGCGGASPASSNSINCPTGWTLNATGTAVASVNLNGLKFNVSAGSPSIGWDIVGDNVPFTTGTSTPTVPATAALNAMLAARCPASGAGAGCLINVPPNTNLLITGSAGAQSGIPISYDGVKVRCMGGHAPQYTAAKNAAACSMSDAGNVCVFVGGERRLGSAWLTPSSWS